MMDNLSMHKGPDIRARMDELGFSYTYTPVYSPQYNGIEEVINIGKKLIKDKRLEMILQNKQENLRKIILDSFQNIEPQKVAKCMARSLELLDLDPIWNANQDKLETQIQNQIGITNLKSNWHSNLQTKLAK